MEEVTGPTTRLDSLCQDMIQMLRASMQSPRSTEVGILMAYLSYHIWLDRNAGLFEGSRLSPRRVVDRAALYAREVIAATVRFFSGIVRDTWGTLHAASAPQFALVSWVPPPLDYLKVNFDGSRSVDGAAGGVGFVIRDHLGRLIAAGGRRTPGLTVVGAELQAAWEGISYAWQVLGVERVCLEGDSSVVIDWLRGADRFGDGHPLIREIRRVVLLLGEVQIGHVFREANRAVDWVASYVARWCTLKYVSVDGRQRIVRFKICAGG
ncbi:uncharacterized protein LOC120109032 [Phoenix dactylifera]|uniref:Uncharacterized protein LOC120109032 n=1 Tax=Phoenix dactylifera TaxID=42345 RepID=A0A8B8ZWL6_PHODC|nr:uncharacterized protein LOC120109032 [Phoenix dactylifera]